jgi:hypothetical protein
MRARCAPSASVFRNVDGEVQREQTALDGRDQPLLAALEETCDHADIVGETPILIADLAVRYSRASRRVPISRISSIGLCCRRAQFSTRLITRQSVSSALMMMAGMAFLLQLDEGFEPPLAADEIILLHPSVSVRRVTVIGRFRPILAMFSTMSANVWGCGPAD